MSCTVLQSSSVPAQPKRRAVRCACLERERENAPKKSNSDGTQHTKRCLTRAHTHAASTQPSIDAMQHSPVQAYMRQTRTRHGHTRVA